MKLQITCAFISNYSEISKIRSGRRMRKCVRFYRSLKILEISFNAYVANQFLPAVLLCCPALQLIGLLGWISKDRYEIEMLTCLAYSGIGVASFACTGFIFSLASYLYNGSDNVAIALRNRATSLNARERPVAKRELRACSAIQVRLGWSHIGKNTTLMIQGICVNQIMNMSLIMESLGV